MDTIYLIPGIGGTGLRWRTGLVGDVDVWGTSLGEIATLSVFLNNLPKLKCDPNGVSQFEIVTNPHPNSTYYGDILAALSSSFNVVWCGYDWRLRPSLSSQRVMIPTPGWLLCHSMGGLVAAHVYARLKGLGQESRIKGIITCGTPWRYWAAADAVDTVLGRGSVINWLIVLGIGYHILSVVRRLLFLSHVQFPDAAVLETFLTWDGLSTLLPNEPWTMRRRETYQQSPGYEFLKQQWLNRGEQEKVDCFFAGLNIPPNLVAEINGTGISTVGTYFQPANNRGDGVVPNDARLTGYPVYQINGAEHAELLNRQETAEIVRLLLAADYPRAVKLDQFPLMRNGVTWRPNPYARPDVLPDINDVLNAIAAMQSGGTGGRGIDP